MLITKEQKTIKMKSVLNLHLINLARQMSFSKNLGIKGSIFFSTYPQP